MRVFMTGATGYIGSRVARQLHQSGHQVIALTRDDARASTLRSGGYESVVGTLNDVPLLQRLAREADGVIHLAFDPRNDFFDEVRREGAIVDALIDALRETGKLLIATTAAGVLGDTGEHPVSETHPINPEFPAAVRAALETRMRTAAAAGVRSVVIRVPILAYGHGGSQFPPLLIETARRTGKAAYVGEGDNRISTAHVDDIATLYRLALEKAAPGSLYNVTGGEHISMIELAEAVRDRVGEHTTLQSLTREQAAEHWNPFVALLLSLNNVVSADKARTELGWTPQGISLAHDIRSGSY
jgi:nucleoside-diphosphate-sugar epimerase